MSDFIHPLQLLIDPQSCCENFSTAAASANLTPPSQLEDTTRRRKNGFRFVSSQVIDHNVIFIRLSPDGLRVEIVGREGRTIERTACTKRHGMDMACKACSVFGQPREWQIK